MKLVNGQVLAKEAQMKKDKSEAFNLGKTVATIERQKKDNKQEAEFNLMQKMQMTEMTMQMRSMFQELNGMLKNAQSGGMPPAAPPAMGAGLPEMPPLPPELMGGGAPPEMGGGMPPEMGGGMPPEMGGGMPPMGPPPAGGGMNPMAGGPPMM